MALMKQAPKPNYGKRTATPKAKPVSTQAKLQAQVAAAKPKAAPKAGKIQTQKVSGSYGFKPAGLQSTKKTTATKTVAKKQPTFGKTISGAKSTGTKKTSVPTRTKSGQTPKFGKTITRK